MGTGKDSFSSVSVSGIKPLMHANDCTYYNKKLFVVPNITGLKKENMYVCDKTAYNKFELETISSPDGGNTFYVAGNIENNGQMDSIYKITLNS